MEARKSVRAETRFRRIKKPTAVAQNAMPKNRAEKKYQGQTKKKSAGVRLTSSRQLE
jgi:hypothetical protein